ncbi:hypothetical protein KZO01_02730 [Kurthia zopfii]|uniref:Rhodanese-related sulfurtransferase n=1 Tax=Kurthia zopfii TaxID=1650 RepID=A0A2U3AF53_9BACL|nr:sulfurtransferase TusA family protein [Kurthia zopfii]PWI23144.1 hypothetical protein DF281_03720 [Kurthia zopfii]TDR41322.1 rhodanese-related sulfurtransferase [Kurthia zopfii]STX09827.1 Sulfurtransferase TusA [Kurthia zopfii]VEI07212.1 Sulfurtransferase TusA [Kurthia zopfii]GEK29964.1 hypothetical protein KZO01_02730 [Kurthia zopfii]
MKVDHQLDVTGMACPMPIVKTKKTMNTLEVGATLEVVSTDAGSKADLPAWADSTGHQYIGLVEEDGKLIHYLRKCDPSKVEQVHFEKTFNVENLDSISSDSLVLDVREEVEYAFGHVKGSISIPFGQLFDNLSQLNKDKTIYVICRSGQRSDLACQMLQKNGFDEVFNVEQGMNGYKGLIEKTI